MVRTSKEQAHWSGPGATHRDAVRAPAAAVNCDHLGERQGREDHDERIQQDLLHPGVTGVYPVISPASSASNLVDSSVKLVQQSKCIVWSCFAFWWWYNI